MMNLTTKVPAHPTQREEEAGSPGLAPCVFCGKIIGHINDCQEAGDCCVGFIAGAIVKGEVKYFLYCADPVCPEREAAEGKGEGVRTCSCEGYRMYDVLGELCPICRKPPCKPEEKGYEA